MAVAAAVAVGIAVSPDGGRTVQAVGSGFGAGGEFHPVTPVRVFDSRDAALDVSYGSIPAGRKPTGPLGSAPEIRIPVLGVGGLPDPADSNEDGSDDNVLAVVVTITVIDPTRSGYLRAFGTGAVEGETSVINYRVGDRLPNSAILRPGSDGSISIRMVTPSGVGTADVAIDVSGWYSTSSWPEAGARTVTIEPTRIYDSREAQFGARALRSEGQVEVLIRGVTAMDDPDTVVVPDDPNVVGVIVNLTGVNVQSGSTRTFASIIPDPVAGVGDVTTSNLNLKTGQVRANLAIAPLAEGDDHLTLFNYAGETHLVLDVVGYLLSGASPDSRAGRIVPLVAPFRVIDTREPEHYNQRLGPARAEDWNFDSFVADVRIGADPVGAQSGLFGNLTATDLQRQYEWSTAQTYLTAYPSPAATTPPNVSNLNVPEGVSVPNLALLRYGSSATGDHEIAVYNRAGYVHYILDVYAVVLADDIG